MRSLNISALGGLGQYSPQGDVSVRVRLALWSPAETGGSPETGGPLRLEVPGLRLEGPRLRLEGPRAEIGGSRAETGGSPG